MIARVKFWMAVNAYALVLDVLGLAFAAVAAAVYPAWLVFIPTAAVAGLLMYSAFGIHASYGQKRRMYFALLRRNAHGLRRSSFKDFISVPCHRLVVRMVLGKLGMSAEYRSVLSAYYVPPWRNLFPGDTVLTIHAQFR